MILAFKKKKKNNNNLFIKPKHIMRTTLGFKIKIKHTCLNYTRSYTSLRFNRLPEKERILQLSWPPYQLYTIIDMQARKKEKKNEQKKKTGT